MLSGTNISNLSWELLLGVSLVLFLALGVWGYRRRRRGRDLAGAQAMEAARQAQLHLPHTLHPVVDPDICIGSLSCLNACPEGDILGVLDGQAALINGSACIGHGKCAAECPVEAIKLVFGTSERGVDLPEVNEFFEASRPGVHIVGELGGMGLIRNALIQGIQVGEFLGQRRVRGGADGALDVVIVGAGPAGLAAALSCKKQGLSYQVLEQETVGGTLAHYPRQKVVMTERVELPLVGKFGKKFISKEELLETWEDIIQRAQLRIRPGVRVTGLAGSDGAFRVQSSAGELAARKVVLAVGRRGSPRKLGVPGEDLPKVAYRLIDPAQYEGAKVLVVGGGDSALEAAIQLAEQTDADVTLSYRNAEFGKCREANKRKFSELVARKHIRAVLPSQVLEVRPQDVVLQVPQGRRRLPNDYVLACLGGELPSAFLGQLGVTMRRYHGQALGEPAEPEPPGGARRLSSKAAEEQRRLRRLALSLGLAGAVIIGVLSLVGGEYYLLSPAERLASPLHKLLKPAGPWGHGVGIVASVFMLSNFLYAVRKRWRRLKGRGSIRGWLIFHQFVGFMSPLVICFHAAFQSRNVLATATAASVAVVVGTGLVGRFFFSLTPTRDGWAQDYEELVARWERLKRRVVPMLDGLTEPSPVRTLLQEATTAAPSGSLMALLARAPLEGRRTRRALRRVAPLFSEPSHFEAFAESMKRLFRMRLQVSFYRTLRRTMSVWRIIHVVLAVALVGMIAAHVAVSLYLGYAWIFG